MQDFLPLPSSAVYWEDLEAIYSNSNILFLHKDAEILFFRVPDLHFMVCEKLPCINYGFVIFCRLQRKLFHAQKLLREIIEGFYAGEEFVRNSTPYSTYSLNLIIKWNEFTTSRPYDSSVASKRVWEKEKPKQ